METVIKPGNMKCLARQLLLVLFVITGSTACGAPGETENPFVSSTTGITEVTSADEPVSDPMLDPATVINPVEPVTDPVEPVPEPEPPLVNPVEPVVEPAGHAPLGAGFTELVPSPDTRIIYVSSSQGSDGNDGWDPATPVRTISRGISLLRDGFPDWLLLRRGDTWYESLGQWKLSGRSVSEPMVVSSYGTDTARPMLKTGSGMGLYVGGNGNAPMSNDYLVFKGLHFYAHTRDPESAEFSSTNGNYGIRWLRGTRGLLIEDNMVESYTTGVSFDDIDNGGVSNLAIRHNVIADSYDTASHSQGIYMSKCDSNVIIEQNILDHNGWHATQSGAEATKFNHGMYLQYSNDPILVHNNIVLRSSSHGIQLRPGGELHGNLIIENSIGLLLGSGTFASNTVRGTVQNNIILNGKNINSAEPRGWGIDLDQTDNATVSNNILAHVFGSQVRDFNLFNSATGTFSNNIVHDWGPGNDTANPGDYVDPNRSIEGYNSFAGGPGTRANFIAQLRAQSAQNWNEDYSIANIKLYFEEGFTLR